MIVADKKKEKLIREVKKGLSLDEKELFKSIAVQVTKNHFTFRMPKGIIKLDGIWEKIVVACEKEKVTYARTGEFATLDELDDVLGDVEWLWHKHLPRGFVSMLVGDPGAGKSAVALDLVRCITNNLAFPLASKSLLQRPGNTVWIDTEASQQILSQRAKLMGLDRSKIHIPVIDGDILGQPNIGDEGHRDQIISLVEYAKPVLLVLDSLGGAHSRGENKTEDIKPIMEFFALLARDYDLAVLIIHHLNKGHEGESAEISLYRIRGSTVISALARSIMAIERGIDDTSKLRMIKSNLASFKTSEAITVIPEMNEEGDIKTFKYKGFVPPEPKRTKKEKCADWVIDQLSDVEEILLMDLIKLGNDHIPDYSRQMIYGVREILGDRVTYKGDGKKSIWSLTKIINDDEAEKQIRKGIRKNGKKQSSNS